MAREEKTPQEDLVSGEAFSIEDWIAPKDKRDAVHIGRKVLLATVRRQINNLTPLLASRGGVCFFQQYANDSEYKILLTNLFAVAGEKNTVISINRERPALESEPHFPDGRTVQLLDMSVPAAGKWLNSSWETLYRSHHSKSWGSPRCATLLYPRNDTLQLLGNLCAGDFTPVPASNLAEVQEDMDCLWNLSGALALCSEDTLNPWVNHIK